LSALGLGAIVNQTNLERLAAVMIPVAAFGLAYRSEDRRGCRGASTLDLEARGGVEAFKRHRYKKRPVGTFATGISSSNSRGRESILADHF
jgi:hypothetical protein